MNFVHFCSRHIPKDYVIWRSGIAYTCDDSPITFPVDISFTTWCNNGQSYGHVGNLCTGVKAGGPAIFGSVTRVTHLKESPCA